MEYAINVHKISNLSTCVLLLKRVFEDFPYSVESGNPVQYNTLYYNTFVKETFLEIQKALGLIAYNFNILLLS